MKNYWLKEKPKARGGFPQDDEFSLQQIAGNGDVCLDMYYPHQFVQNEVLTPVFEREKCENLTLQHTPVLPGTTTGTVYLKNKPIQVFVISSKGDVTFQADHRLSPSKVKVISIKQNVHTGEMYFVWNEKPDNHQYVISYEYNMECQQDDMGGWEAGDTLDLY